MALDTKLTKFGNPVQQRPLVHTPQDQTGVLRTQKEFLEAFSRLGNVLKAAESVGMTRQTHYDWLDHDPTYQVRYQHAQEAFGDRIHSKFTSAILEAEPHDVLLHPVAAIAELKRWFPEYRENPQIYVDNRSVTIGDLGQARRTRPS